MGISQNLSFLGMVASASLLVQVVMGILLLASLMSWWYIFQKYASIGRMQRRSRDFERDFWGGADLATLYGRVNARRDAFGMEKIFESGFEEFLKMKKQGVSDSDMLLQGTRRAMTASFQREIDYLDTNLSFLGTVGSTSPYVGLFGTVWGIMNAFEGLANVAAATLAHVAPGIAEALITTAMGLFAAIPAVIAYNRFSHDIDRLQTQFESFMDEFINILQRQVIRA
ncbi:MAG: protein TolQ [Pseudomonadota bacterium]|nr:protein TolQ [Pseudomonadota bacterium]